MSAPHPCAGAGEERAFEVADVFRWHGPSYLSAHLLSPVQSRAYQDILHCRTAACGGRMHRCDRCGSEVPVYNSCLKRAYRRGELRFPGTLARLASPEAFDEFLEAPTD